MTSAEDDGARQLGLRIPPERSTGMSLPASGIDHVGALTIRQLLAAHLCTRRRNATFPASRSVEQAPPGTASRTSSGPRESSMKSVLAVDDAAQSGARARCAAA
jgi:hypothetical protein